MKSYHSLQYWDDSLIGNRVWAFDKLDGSNMRFEWSRKRGWYKFGTRRTMIDESNEQFGDAIPLFLDKYGEGLERIFKDDKKYRNINSFVVFAEYFGENSFAGNHDPKDEKDIVIFDISQYKKGWIHPKDFINDFSHLDIPNLIYDGIFDEDFVEQIKNDTNLIEGVICKGSKKTKGDDIVYMFKLKTNKWLTRLKNEFGEDALLEDTNGKIKLI